MVLSGDGAIIESIDRLFVAVSRTDRGDDSSGIVRADAGTTEMIYPVGRKVQASSTSEFLFSALERMQKIPDSEEVKVRLRCCRYPSDMGSR